MGWVSRPEVEEGLGGSWKGREEGIRGACWERAGSEMRFCLHRSVWPIHVACHVLPCLAMSCHVIPDDDRHRQTTVKAS